MLNWPVSNKQDKNLFKKSKKKKSKNKKPYY